jgi:hypothetical protein
LSEQNVSPDESFFLAAFNNLLTNLEQNVKPLADRFHIPISKASSIFTAQLPFEDDFKVQFLPYYRDGLFAMFCLGWKMGKIDEELRAEVEALGRRTSQGR